MPDETVFWKRKQNSSWIDDRTSEMLPIQLCVASNRTHDNTGQKRPIWRKGWVAGPACSHTKPKPCFTHRCEMWPLPAVRTYFHATAYRVIGIYSDALRRCCHQPRLFVGAGQTRPVQTSEFLCEAQAVEGLQPCGRQEHRKQAEQNRRPSGGLCQHGSEYQHPVRQTALVYR